VYVPSWLASVPCPVAPWHSAQFAPAPPKTVAPFVASPFGTAPTGIDTVAVPWPSLPVTLAVTDTAPLLPVPGSTKNKTPVRSALRSGRLGLSMKKAVAALPALGKGLLAVLDGSSVVTVVGEVHLTLEPVGRSAVVPSDSFSTTLSATASPAWAVSASPDVETMSKPVSVGGDEDDAGEVGDEGVAGDEDDEQPHAALMTSRSELRKALFMS
jgi:hypothetical protein